MAASPGLALLWISDGSKTQRRPLKPMELDSDEAVEIKGNSVNILDFVVEAPS